MEELSSDGGARSAPTRPVDGALAGALRRGRDKFNQRFMAARRVYRQLEADDFYWHLSQNLAPLLDAAERAAPARVDEVCDELYGLSCELVARKWLGPEARFSLINRLWRVYLVELGRFWVDQPRRVIGGLTRAAYSLAEIDPVKANNWARRLAELGPNCPDVEVLLDVGRVLAWRVGMPHFRPSALKVWRRLSSELRYQTLCLGEAAGQALGDAADRPDLALLEQALEDPWFEPAGLLSGAQDEDTERPGGCKIWEVGGFVGLGGEFSAPPRVFSRGEYLYACDGRVCYRIFVDAFGALLSRAGVEVSARELVGRDNGDSGSDWRALERFSGAARELPGLIDATSRASNAWTWALSVAHSHKVFLMPRDQREDVDQAHE